MVGAAAIEEQELRNGRFEIRLFSPVSGGVGLAPAVLSVAAAINQAQGGQ